MKTLDTNKILLKATSRIAHKSPSLQQLCNTNVDVLSPQQLRYTIDYIQANLNKALHLPIIATHLDLSYYYFCSLFKKSMGISPWQYVITQRIDRAKELLKEQKLSIAEIALACGFSHYSLLNKHFQKVTGTTPGNYQCE
jgi:AraC family transcriptional regulator